MGKANRENPIETWLGESFPIGNAYSQTVKKGRSFFCVCG